MFHLIFKISVLLDRYRDFKRSLQQVTDMTCIDAARKASEALVLVNFSCSKFIHQLIGAKSQ